MARTAGNASRLPGSTTRPRPSILVWLSLVAVVASGIAVRIALLDHVQTRGPDEKFYTYFASRVADEGLGATRTLFEKYEADSAMWSFPVPTRISYVLLVAAAMKIANQRDASCGATVSCLLSILSLFLLAWTGLRFFNPWVAVGAVAFMAFSVGELGIAPRAWVDATFAFLGLLLLYVTCEITRDPRRTLWYPAFFGAGMLLILTKQTGVVAYGLCALWAMWVVARREQYSKGAALIAAGGLLSIVLTIWIWGLLAGGVGVAFSAFDHSLHPGAMGTAYIEEYSSGPWYRFIYLLWVVGPLTAALVLGGGMVTALRRRVFSSVAEGRAAACGLLMTLGFIAFCGFVPGMQNLRYIAPADGAYCLLAGIGLWYLMSRAQKSWTALRYRALLVVAIAIAALDLARDYQTLVSVLHSGMQDLPARGILERNLETVEPR